MKERLVQDKFTLWSAGSKPLRHAVFAEFDLNLLRSQPLDVDVVFMGQQWFKRHINHPDSGNPSKGAFVSSRSKIAEGVFAAPRAVVMHDVFVGHGSKLLHESVIYPFANISDHVIIGPYTVVYKYATVGSHCLVGPNVSVGPESEICYGTIVQGDSKLPTTIGKKAVLFAGVIVRRGNKIPVNERVLSTTVVESPAMAELVDAQRPE